MLEKLGVGGHLDLALQLENNYWQAFIRGMEPTTGSFEFLEACRSIGVPVVVMTDLTLQIQFKKLIYLNLVTYLHAVIASEEVGADKPSPRFITYAQKSLGLDLSEVWVIGDDPSKDGLLAEACHGEFFLVSASQSGRESFKSISKRLVEATS
jgi:putative hydrolase of the HAD superfamily